MTTDAPAPTADWIDFDELFRDPYDTYRRLQEQGPVVFVPAMGHYFVTSHAACREVEADQEVFTAHPAGQASVRPLGGLTMLGKDDPEHAAERAPINRAMRPKNVRESWAPLFERNARTCLEALVQAGPDAADLNRDFAGPLAARNLCDVLGIPDAQPEDMVRWSTAFIDGQFNLMDDAAVWERAVAARREVDALLDELVPHYRAHPDASLISAWAGSGLSRDDVYADVKLTIAGGLNEPKHMVSTLVWALTENPEQRALLEAEPGLWADAFDEGVRLVSPIGLVLRQTTRATTLAGVDLPAGAIVSPVLAAANRDPQVYEQPDAYDLRRPKVAHLGFGSGTHQCAGHWAARIGIGETALPLLYRELPGLRLDRRRPVTWFGFVFRGLQDAPVTWDAA